MDIFNCVTDGPGDELNVRRAGVGVVEGISGWEVVLSIPFVKERFAGKEEERMGVVDGDIEGEEVVELEGEDDWEEGIPSGWEEVNGG